MKNAKIQKIKCDIFVHKNDLSGNTVCPQTSNFHKITKSIIFGIF